MNCAAYTNVDGAESERDAALRVNADGARNVAKAAAEIGAAVLYPSTDYVFDGTKGQAYVESDEPAPAVQLRRRPSSAGEVETAAATRHHFIVRTSWLFGAAGKNFVRTMLDLGRREDQVAVVRDQTGCPTWTAHLAEGMVRLLSTRAYGLHHMASGGQLHLVRLRHGDLRGCRRGLPGDVHHHGRDRPPRAASGVLRAGDPVGGRDLPARLARRPARLPGGGGGVKLLVTGGAGFIGSTYVRLAGAEHDVVVLDKLTYAGRRENLEPRTFR